MVLNFIAAFFILGVIGLLEIPLDMMTITIAAITIGIAVDNSIHYIYRFKEEFKRYNNYDLTLDRCHSTVGVAILNGLNNYSVRIFYFGFVQFHTHYLLWYFYWNSYVVCNDICLNFVT